MERKNDGKFAKGNKGGGRPAGSKNKATIALRERVNDLIKVNWERVQEDMEQLEPKERIDMLIRLLEFSIPKLQRTAITEDKPTPIKITFVNHEKDV